MVVVYLVCSVFYERKNIDIYLGKEFETPGKPIDADARENYVEGTWEEHVVGFSGCQNRPRLICLIACRRLSISVVRDEKRWVMSFKMA
jgi:hypothetical protein